MKKELKGLKLLLSLEKPREAVKKRGRRRSRPLGIRKCDMVKNRLIDELIRITILEEKIESTLSEAFLNLFDEPLKQKMYTLAMESAMHNHMLIKTVNGLEKFKMKYKEHFLDAPPFKFQGKPTGGILENLHALETSAAMVYETILKLLDKLSDKTEIKKGGLRIIPENLKFCCKKISATKKLHISIIEENLSLYKDTHAIPRF